MVDTFIRPPVNIKIYFKKAIKLDKIIIMSKLNTHNTNGFVISTSIDDHNANCKFSKITYKQISKVINEESNKLIINKYIFQRRVFNNDTNNLDTKIQYFSTNCMKYLNSIHSINIELIRTANSTSACIKALNIFGNLVDNHDIKHECINEIASCSNIKEKLSNEIPVEFLDEITHEIMTMPILLPSGHIVDQTSLDKYFDEQRLLNSNFKPNDPFTRIEFNNITYKPIINDKLKARINHYLLNNKPNLSLTSSNVQKSCLSYNESKSSKRKFETNEEIFKELVKPKIIELNMNNEKIEQNATTSITNCLNKRVKIEVIECCCCLNRNNLNLYEISTCKHVYCRDCIFKLNNLCLICKNKFLNSQVSNLKITNF